MPRWVMLSGPLGLPASTSSCPGSFGTPARNLSPLPRFPVALARPLPCLRRSLRATVSPTAVHLGFAVAIHLAPLGFYSFRVTCFSCLSGRCFIRLSLTEPSPVSEIHFLNRATGRRLRWENSRPRFYLRVTRSSAPSQPIAKEQERHCQVWKESGWATKYADAEGGRKTVTQNYDKTAPGVCLHWEPKGWQDAFQYKCSTWQNQETF